MRSVIAAFLLFALAAPTLAATTTRLLFIGNRLTSANDIPRAIEKIAAATGRAVKADSVTVDRYSLEDHWKDGEALRAIGKGWDVVVLQQGPSADEEARAQLADYAKRFEQKIRATGARTALLMVWPTADRLRDFRAVIASYRAAAKAANATLLPAGEAWLRVLGKDKRARLYEDSATPSRRGSALAALTIYLGLFPAGPQEFDDAFVGRISAALDLPADVRGLYFDAATLAIDEPLAVQ